MRWVDVAEMAVKECTLLKKALYVLLYDQFEDVASDLEDIDAPDETYIDYIISALIEKNEFICPFKNYDSSHRCKLGKKCNDNDLEINCEIEAEEVWKHFIEF